MNLKAIMFAGIGLTVSIGGTSWWVGNDMANIRARQQAKLERCEQLRAQVAPASTGAATGGAFDPATAAGTTTAGAPAAPTDPATAAALAECPAPAPSAGGAGTEQGTDGSAVDEFGTADADGFASGGADEFGEATTEQDPFAQDGTTVHPDGSTGSTGTSDAGYGTSEGAYVDPNAAGAGDPVTGGFDDGGTADPAADAYVDPTAAPIIGA